MRRRITVLWITALTLAGGGALAAVAGAAPAAPATAGNAASTAAVRFAVTGTGGRPPAGAPVLGMFEMKGGAMPTGAHGTPVHPLRGTVMFRGAQGHATDLTAGKNGHFTGTVPAGTYTVTARSPQIQQQNANGTDSEPACAGPVTVVARAGYTIDLTLVCYVA